MPRDDDEIFSPSDARKYERADHGRKERKEKKEKRKLKEEAQHVQLTKLRKELLRCEVNGRKEDGTFGTKTLVEEAREEVLDAGERETAEKKIRDAKRHEEAAQQFPETQQQVG